MNFFLDFDTITLIAGLLIFISILFFWHVSKDTPFDMQNVLVENGVFSLSKLGQLIALGISSWVMVYQTRHGQMSEWLFTGYMLAWAGANFASKWLDRKKPDDTNQK
jgi:hypothetical protein